MSMRVETFTLTWEHVRLLQRANISWQDCETGAPEIDPKRPYGNSFVAGDIAEILGIKWDDDEMPGELRDRLMGIHRETETALQVILASKSFELGRYELENRHHRASWRRVVAAR